MKFATGLVSVLVPTLVVGSFFGGQQTVLDDDLDIPGDNSLHFCSKDDSYTLEITKVDLDPNPPKAGETLTIAAEGEFTEKVEKGSYINVSVKYGLIKLISLKIDLCEQMSQVNESCPLSGKKRITKEVEIPSEVPPGTYSVFADVYNKDNEHVTCLTGSMKF